MRAVVELSERLARWTEPHPSWRPNPEWPEEVGWVLYRHADALVLIDPLVRDDLDPDAWNRLDAAVAAAAAPVAVLLTAPWHERSTRAVAARYGARVWLHHSARTRVRRVRELAAPPPGIEVFVPRGVDEGQVAFFLSPERTLVVAELFVGVPGGLRVCPSPATVDEREFSASLRELQRWEVERVLVAHGPPILGGGSNAIDAALEAFDAR